LANKQRGIRPRVTICISDTKELVLHRTLPFVDECKTLICNMVKQAFRDYCNFYYSKSIVGLAIFEEAQKFIFEDDYVTSWGEKERNLTDFLDILNLDIHWFRYKVEEKRKEKYLRKKKRGRQEEEEDDDGIEDLFDAAIRRDH
jgi:hypothetical protein